MFSKVTLKSSDGEYFDVDKAVAAESQILSHIIEDVYPDSVIPVPNVNGRILSKVIEYCKKHFDHNSIDFLGEDLKSFNAEFVKVDKVTLFELTRAADYLNIKSLHDLTCRTIADMIKEKTSAEIRRILNIKNDFTPEEEEEEV